MSRVPRDALPDSLARLRADHRDTFRSDALPASPISTRSNNPSQVHLSLGVDGTPAQDGAVDESAMLYTVAVGLAAAIGVLLIVSMGWVGYSKLKKCVRFGIHC